MKRIFLILCLITICNISYADIASVGYVDSVVATKQDKLPTGTSGQILTQTDNGIAWTDAPEVPEIPENIITNTATGDYGAIAIGEYAEATGDDAMAINGSAYGEYSLAINGYSDGYGAIAISGSDEIAHADGYAALAVGNNTYADGEEAIAIGAYANADAEYAIQLGDGENPNPRTFNVGFGYNNGKALNYTLLESDGKIPLERLPTGPSDGIYTLVWNGKFGTFTFQKESGVLSCPSGQYDIGFGQCVGLLVEGDDYTGDPSTNTWSTTFSYGTVTGIASCNSTNGTYAQSTTANFSQSSRGRYCWCKMTSPAVSRWVFNRDDDDAVDCANFCVYRCTDSVQYDSDFRSGVFSSVGK